MTFPAKHPIETLTQQALAAAEAGHWGHVALLYERRTSQFDLDKVSPAVAKRLIHIDQVVQERARVVQAATQQSLNDAQEQRRKLRQWQQQWKHSLSRGGRLIKAV